MAQRVFLVQMAKTDLARAADAIVGNAQERRAFAADLATRSALHLRRVTASELVIDAVGAAAASSEAWGYARNCMPYLLATTTADKTLSALRELEPLEKDADLEEFFVAQAKALRMKMGDFNRDTFRAPEATRTEEWIRGLLDRAADLHAKDDIEDYAVSTWIWLGQIFARTTTCFWQGRNRWLGGAAFPESFQTHTTVTSVGILGRIKQAVFPAPEQPPRVTGVARLRPLLTSVATLAPALARPKWEAPLAKEGGGSLASGGVAHDRLGDLVAAVREGELPYGRDWAEIVVAAAAHAKANDAHLVEGDDAIYGAYRWPAIEPVEES